MVYKVPQNERVDISRKTISPLLLFFAVGQQSSERGGVTAATIQNSFVWKKKTKKHRDKRGISGYGHWKPVSGQYIVLLLGIQFCLYETSV